MQVENQIKGAMTALITPFRNNVLDLGSYESLIKRQIKYGIDAVVPLEQQVKAQHLAIKSTKSVLK